MTRSLPSVLPCLALAILLAAGCAKPPPAPPVQAPIPPSAEIGDISRLSQDPMAHLDPARADVPLLAAATSQARWQDLVTRHFSPWDRATPRTSKDEAGWAIAAYATSPGFGENLRPRDPAWMQSMASLADLDRYPAINLKGVTVAPASLRALPTDKPLFRDPSLPGEGFPFDYLQNSMAWAGTPVFIAHASLDGAWLYVETSFASGWVPRRDVVLVDEPFIRAWRTARYLTPLNDDLPLADDAGAYRLTARIGMLLPLSKDGSSVLLPAMDAQGRGVITRGPLPQDLALGPLNPTARNFALLAGQLMGEPYGWGGILANRDCSAMTRDLLGPFGLWLPRNSSAQAKHGEYLDVSSLSGPERETALLAKGIPWLTLVWLKGHVMLYIGPAQYGPDKGRPLVLHDVWGLRTDDDSSPNGIGRRIIGKVVITTLTPGAELPELKKPQGLLRERVQAFTILAR